MGSDYETSTDEDSERSGFHVPNLSDDPQAGDDDDDYKRAPDDDAPLEFRTSLKSKNKKKNKYCCFYLRRFDEFCMKPIFIRRYNAKKAHMAEEFAFEYMKLGDKTD